MNNHAPCPDEGMLRDYAARRLAEPAAAGVRDHLAGCPACRSLAARFREAATPNPAAPGTVSFGDPEAALPTVGVTAGPSQDDIEEDPLEGLGFLEPSDNPQALGRISHYEVLSVLGRGGMGVVLKAFDTSLHRTVALKLLSPQLASSQESRRRFRREARAAAGINHPNVVTIHAVEELAGMPYLVMEYVAGRSLRERIRDQPNFDLASLLRIGSQIAAGLAAAHQQGVIHRDVKPANIMLEDGIERVKLTDFGLALVALDASLITSAERVVGTPSYMSPEQVRGERVGPRSDLFSLGCVLYAMVTGKSPFHGSHALEVARKVADLDPPPLQALNAAVPRQLSEITARLLQKDPNDRFQSAAEVHQLLQEYLARISQGDSGSLVVPPAPRKPRRRRPWLTAAGIAAAVLVLAALLAWLGPKLRPPTSPESSSTPAATRARVLRVSRTSEADYRSIGAALFQATPGCTIRVLDDATYTEAVTIDDPVRLRDITLEAERRATIATREGPFATFTIRNTPGVTLRGFQVSTAFNQHGLFLCGDLAGVTIEDVVCKQPADSQWVNVYLAGDARGTTDRPLRIHRCEIHTAKMGLMIGDQYNGGSAQVEVENNRFVGTGTHIMLVVPAEAIRVRGNLFLEGQGLFFNPGDFTAAVKKVQVSNNTFWQTPSWLRAAGGLESEDVVVCNNLILGAEQLAVQDGRLADLVRKWSFRHNWWEPGPTTDAETARLVAEVRPAAGLAGRQPGDPDFLRPAPDSPLLKAGAGGDWPRHVGALLPRGKDE